MANAQVPPLLGHRVSRQPLRKASTSYAQVRMTSVEVTTSYAQVRMTSVEVTTSHVQPMANAQVPTLLGHRVSLVEMPRPLMPGHIDLSKRTTVEVTTSHAQVPGNLPKLRSS
jgi:hypothetical protein